MRTSLYLLAALLFGTGLLAQQPNDHSPYAGTLRSFTRWYTRDAPDSIYTLFNDRVKAQLTMDSWRAAFPQIKGALGAIDIFDLDATGKGYVNYIVFGSKGAMGLLLSMDSSYRIQGIFPRQNPARSSYHTNYKVHTPDGDLSGELVMPVHAAGTKPPVVLIIAGSGPTDRNGNNAIGLRTDCYKLLASGLAERGIASLRYDKRWIGESTHFKGLLDSLRFEDYVNDAKTCIRQLKKDTSFSSVFVIGHSEGALIGAIVARKEKVSGFVSLAGAGVPAETILRRQMVRMGLDNAGVEKMMDSLKKGKELYMATWNKYDPAREIARLEMPVSIIQGLRDLQVGKEDAEKLQAAAPNASLLYMDSMNHVLKNAPADREGNLATYARPEILLYADLVPAIEAFIKGRRRR